MTDVTNLLADTGAKSISMSDYADQLCGSGMTLREELVKALPDTWLALKFKKRSRLALMELYKSPDNYKMLIPVLNNNLLDKHPMAKAADASHRKLQMCMKDVLAIQLAQLNELQEDIPDGDKVYQMGLDAVSMALHACGSAHRDRIKNLEQKIAGTTSVDAGVPNLLEMINLKELVKKTKD